MDARDDAGICGAALPSCSITRLQLQLSSPFTQEVLLETFTLVHWLPADQEGASHSREAVCPIPQGPGRDGGAAHAAQGGRLEAAGSSFGALLLSFAGVCQEDISGKQGAQHADVRDLIVQAAAHVSILPNMLYNCIVHSVKRFHSTNASK